MRTAHSAQIRLASRDDPPFSGKKISGSKSRHRALSCHGMKWCTAPLPRNYIPVILDHLGLETQVRGESFSDLGPSHHLHPDRGRIAGHMQAVEGTFSPVSLLDDLGKPT